MQFPSLTFAGRKPAAHVVLLMAVWLLWAFQAGAAQAGAQAPTKDWWIAVDQDQVSTVQRLLLQGVDPNARNPRGNPALTQAAREQSWKVFDTLAITPGVRLDEPNGHDETALMYLCILGQTQRAVALIDAGAQVNRLGWTPLHYAASKGRLETAQMLIQHGAIINAPGPDGTTPLMMAALSGSTPTVQLLLDHGADPTMFNLAHETAVDWARRGNHGSLATQLEAVVAAHGRDHSDTAAARVPPQPAAQAPKGPGTASGKAGSTEDEGSFSRYFDLDRFKDDEAGHR